MNRISDLCTVIVPTFFPGKEIFNNLNSIPPELKILIIDNSYNLSLKKKISKYENCDYYNIGDVGLGKTFNFALSKIKTPYILLTQPDVILRNNCISNLISGFDKYQNAGMVVPLVYDNNVYSKYDFYDLKYSKKKKIFLTPPKKNKISVLPSGDFCVDAVNATTMLIKVEALKKINGWDDSYYVYLEDIDICLRLKLNNYSIIKIANAEVDHLGWSSHYSEIKNTMNISRIWHFTWSSLYFEDKFCRRSILLKKLIKIISISILKLLLNLIILRFSKVNQNFIKLSACAAFIFKRGSYFRVKHEIKKK
jgi:N-acetylglucosaminyl-diphospho-decaprenol L-rhamnosyltransferase